MEDHDVADDASAALLKQLASSDADERIKAREQLAEIGSAAVPGLLVALDDEQQHVRWEAAKTLESIADSRSIPKLVDTLGDDDGEVRWIAGEALIAMGGECVADVCDGIIRTRDSIDFYKAAHHVLNELAKKPKLQAMLSPLLAAFRSPEPQIAVPVAAEEILEAIRG